MRLRAVGDAKEEQLHKWHGWERSKVGMDLWLVSDAGEEPLKVPCSKYASGWQFPRIKQAELIPVGSDW